MEALAPLLFLYSVGMTIAFFITLSSRKRYVRKSDFLTRKIKQMVEEENRRTVPQRPQNEIVRPAAPVTVAQPVETKPVFAPAATAAPAAPQPQPQAQPQPQKTEPEVVRDREAIRADIERKEAAKKISAVGVSFTVGVLLLVISAAVFLTAKWHVLGAGIKCILLFGVVAVVYGLCAFSRTKLKLEKTSSGMYVLASLLLPLAITGGYLALEIDRVLIMLLLCAASLVITGFVGYKIFDSKFHVSMSFFGYVWSVIFICMEVIDKVEGFAFGLCAAAILTCLVWFFVPKLKFFDIFSEITAYLSIVGFVMTFAFSNKFIALAFIAQAFSWISLMLITKKRDFVKFFSPAVLAGVMLFTLIKTDAIFWGRSIGIAIFFVLFTVFCFGIYKLTKLTNFASNATFVIGISSMLYYFAYDMDIKDILFWTAISLPIAIVGFVMLTTKSKEERGIGWYLVGLTTLILFKEAIPDYIYPYIYIGLFAAAVFVTFKFKSINVPIAAGSTMIISLLMEYDVFNKDIIAIIMLSIFTVLYGGYVLVTKLAETDKAQALTNRIVLMVPLIIANFTLFGHCIDGGEVRNIIILLVIDAITTAITLFEKDNYLGALPAVTMTAGLIQLVSIYELGEYLILPVVMVFVYVMVGRFLLCENVISRNRIDWFTIFALIFVFTQIEHPYKVFMLLTFYCLTFIGRFGKADMTLKEKVMSKLFVILSSASYLLAFMFVSLTIDASYDVSTELCVSYILAAGLISFFLLKKSGAGRWIWFVTVCVCLTVESLSALAGEEALALTIVSLAGVGIFIYSFIAKKKSWFILSIVTVSELGLLFAAIFWENKLWWIYLLVMGGIFIVTASINEFKRRKALEEGLEDKRIRIFEDWTW